MPTSALKRARYCSALIIRRCTSRSLCRRAAGATQLKFEFIDKALNADTVKLAAGATMVVPFVNDDLSAPLLAQLAGMGVRAIALRWVHTYSTRGWPLPRRVSSAIAAVLDHATSPPSRYERTGLFTCSCAGFNNVDLATAEQLKIAVLRVPAYSPTSVAEHAVALLMALNRHLKKSVDRSRHGNFDLQGLVGRDISSLTVGVVGTGKIGYCFAKIMHGFGGELAARLGVLLVAERWPPYHHHHDPDEHVQHLLNMHVPTSCYHWYHPHAGCAVNRPASSIRLAPPPLLNHHHHHHHPPLQPRSWPTTCTSLRTRRTSWV